MFLGKRKSFIGFQNNFIMERVENGFNFLN